jgi:hypothetical protein
MLYMHPVFNGEHSEPLVQRKSHLDGRFLNLKMNRMKIMYFWYLTQCEPVVHICSIAATQPLRRASTDPPLFNSLETSRIDPRQRAQRET